MSRLYELRASHHPKCPGCGHVHPVKHVNEVYVVKTDYCLRDKKYLFNKKGEPSKCKWNGTLTENDYIKGIKRSGKEEY